MLAVLLIEKLAIMAVCVVLIVMGYKLYSRPARRTRRPQPSDSDKVEGRVGPWTIILSGESLGMLFMLAGAGIIAVMAWRAPSTYRKVTTREGVQIESVKSAGTKGEKPESRNPEKSTNPVVTNPVAGNTTIKIKTEEYMKPMPMKAVTKDASQIKQLKPDLKDN